MNNIPLVSVVMACYNGIEYLQQQLDSLDKQNYLNIEIIIVDDASLDGTYEYLVSYAATRYNYLLVRNEVNLGVVKSFERAISLASGEYIALCDQDDIWFPNKVQMLMSNIGDSYLIHSDANLINQYGNIINNSYFASCKHDINNYPQYLIENNVTGCTCLFKKELLSVINYQFPLGITVHDRLLAILAAKINKIKYLDMVLMSYRQHQNNQVGAVSNNSIIHVISRHLQDLDALSTQEYFNNDVNLELARKYYRAMLKDDCVTFGLLAWIIRYLGFTWCIKYILKVLIK